MLGDQKVELDTALGYFEHNAPRMRCHWFRSRGLFTGSGVPLEHCLSTECQTPALYL